ncbi:MAG: aminotransferase class IV [Bacteroidales bacterium]|nr:aminotransferase class IV [Bacteroidales bacterium]
MKGTRYICNNGIYLKDENPVLFASNRAFLYGDALFETIHANGTRVQFFNFHLERLKKGMQLLKMNIPGYFTSEYFAEHIRGVLARNKFFKGARVRLTVFRNSNGLYTPETNDVQYIIDSAKLESDVYVLNQTGYTVDLYTGMYKPVNMLSQLKTTNALPFVLAGIFKKENNLEDCIVLNENKRICESVGSNIFIVKGEKVYTPALSEGCLPGVMRNVICGLIKSEGISLNDDSRLTATDLLTADEFFLTNAVSGIRWVVAFRQRRYYNKLSKILINKLNRLAFEDQFI